MKRALDHSLCLLIGLVILTGCVFDNSVSAQRESRLPQVTIPNGRSPATDIHVTKEPQVKGSSPTAGATTQEHFTEVIELPRQTLILEPTRDDITVGCMIFSLYHSDMGKEINLDAVRVNGVRPDEAQLYLKQVGRNQFELPAMTIEFSSEGLGGPLYLTLKAWFNELTNQYDSGYYVNVPDRYALVSYCTKEDEDPSKVNARLGANRVKTLKEFTETLARPFVIKLNQQPLREEWGRYPMINPLPSRLAESELKAIEQTVRDRGEQFVIGISISDSDHARVGVGNGTFFRTARVYQVVRSDGTWRIESVRNVDRASP